MNYSDRFFLAGISEDSDYTSDVGLPYSAHHPNSSIHQFSSQLHPYRSAADDWSTRSPSSCEQVGSLTFFCSIGYCISMIK